jgi:hypothetical protein
MHVHRRKLDDPAPYCPRCHVVLNGLAYFGGGPMPRPKAGLGTVCSYCTAILEFREVAGGLALVELTGAARAAILADPDPKCDIVRRIVASGGMPAPPGTKRH